MGDEFLTVAEVAEKLKLNQQTIRNWIEQGTLPALRVGRRVRIRHSDLDALINGGSTVAPAPDAVARQRLASASDALAAVSAGEDDEALASALRELSAAALVLADVIAGR